MKKISLFFLIILFTTIVEAQVSTDIGAGFDIDSQVPVMALNLSYESKQIVVEGTFTPTITRQVNRANYAGFRIGYDIEGAGIIPSVGYYYNFYNSDQKKDFNKWRAGYSLKVKRLVSDNGGVFVNGLYCNSVQLTGGIYYQF